MTKLSIEQGRKDNHDKITLTKKTLNLIGLFSQLYIFGATNFHNEPSMHVTMNRFLKCIATLFCISHWSNKKTCGTQSLTSDVVSLSNGLVATSLNPTSFGAFAEMDLAWKACFSTSSSAFDSGSSSNAWLSTWQRNRPHSPESKSCTATKATKARSTFSLILPYCCSRAGWLAPTPSALWESVCK